MQGVSVKLEGRVGSDPSGAELNGGHAPQLEEFRAENVFASHSEHVLAPVGEKKPASQTCACSDRGVGCRV